MSSVQRPVAITIGDPAGIGPEIIVKAFRDAPDVMPGCFVAGDVGTVRRAAQALAVPGVLAPPVAVIEMPGDVVGVPPGCIPVLQAIEPPEIAIAVGQISALAGRMAGDCVVWAARAALRGEIAAIVTAPLHKEALSAAGFSFPGHTELLQAEAAAYLGRPIAKVPVRMMLANDELRTVLVSIHMSLRDAIEAVTFDGVLETLRITQTALTAVLGRAPRIGVAGLNPHAGEGGLFGSEERDIIVPAISAAQSEGIDADGPHAPDTIFMRARAKANGAGEFDVVIAMYHDQGLIPVKYLGVEKGVNVTLGLPLVRTSPDHGTAFDIAGMGRADPSSLVEAVRMAKSLSGAVRDA
ncbi:4-hydroxythreonine-4-phosphate dehydrogenase PdxA [Variovorax sp. J22R24]|uniref:4-hydroxythreonine-4-phosphate dehydrogenase PdxA n=1 Tax=Variovorax gracilis TaxID=3053502 RepID=UPI002578EAFE|nr:4-hydroxythreonine-4-phosphate dehydrogenase PdxA [Variovorax sp. J22R24]MDM0104872.1 4-hydroxythreonine-4-phosphate dehydrogenase PdxA [Variovorax sp. J22R24]